MKPQGIKIAILLAAACAGAAGWQRMSDLTQKASPGVLSEHELLELEGLPPQEQAERLVKRAVGGYRGAVEQIEARVPGWKGSIELNAPLNTLLSAAYCSQDLRVRGAAVEISLAGYGLPKSPESVESQIRLTEEGTGKKFFPLWKLGLLGNRGVEREKVMRVLLDHLDDSEQVNRMWAVNALGMVGTDDVIEPLVEVFRSDPAPEIRERAACNIADAGMLSRQQRWKAIPHLLKMTDDASLDEQTRGWVFQALREISGESMDASPAAWRVWWDRRGRQ